MNIINKMIKVAGKDKNGIARPFSVIEDDSGEFVLRVVDAAPFLLEYGKFDNAIHTSRGIYNTSKKILDTNTDRKFINFTNISEGTIYLSFNGEASFEKGIALKPKEIYEMNTLKGNLFKGAIYAISNNNLMEFSDVNLFNYEMLVQGGLAPSTGLSTSLTRVTSIPYNLYSNETYKISIISDTIKIRNIVSYDNSNYIEGYSIKGDGIYNEIVFNRIKSLTGVSFCKINIAEEVTPTEVATANIMLSVQKPSLLVTEGF